MNEELDFEDYPTLHLNMMIDDYDELIREGERKTYEKESNERSHSRESEIDPQGRFSFCFMN